MCDVYKKEPGIYIFTNLINGKVYIGESMNIRKRMGEHNRMNINSAFHNALRKYGEDNFKVDIEYFPDFKKSDLLDLEEALIKRFDCLTPNGYNICNRGTDRTGLITSDETRKKISEANKGKTISDEQREKISESNKTRTISNKTKSKMSESSKGKTHSDITRAKMSESQTGNKNHMYGKTLSAEHRAKISNAAKNRRNIA